MESNIKLTSIYHLDLYNGILFVCDFLELYGGWMWLYPFAPQNSLLVPLYISRLALHHSANTQVTLANEGAT